MTTTSDSKQRYVYGSNVPGFFWGKNYFPNSVTPDTTSFALCTILQVQFKLGDSGTVKTVAASASTKTIDGTSRTGLLVSGANMVANLTSASDLWYWRFACDLAGDTLLCYSEWQQFIVYK